MSEPDFEDDQEELRQDDQDEEDVSGSDDESTDKASWPKMVRPETKKGKKKKTGGFESFGLFSCLKITLMFTSQVCLPVRIVALSTRGINFQRQSNASLWSASLCTLIHQVDPHHS